MLKHDDDPEEITRFVARRSWLVQLEKECLRWGVPRSQVIVDAVTRYALGPKGLAAIYGRRDEEATVSTRRGHGKSKETAVLP